MVKRFLIDLLHPPRLIKIPIVIFLYSFCGDFLFFQEINWMKIGLFWVVSWILFILVCLAVGIDILEEKVT